MRTKTLLLAAALSAAGLASSMAQSNVYSINVVGYINVPVTKHPNALSLIANQLNAAGGNTMNNTMGTNNPQWAGCSCITFDPVGQVFITSTYNNLQGKWNPDVNPGLSPGRGTFFKNSASGNGPTNITFVGEVPQGALSDRLVGGGVLFFEYRSIPTPLAGGITTVGGLNTTNIGIGSKSYQWDNSLGGTYGSIPSKPIRTVGTFGNPIWPAGQEPILAVGEATVLQVANPTPGNWTLNFTVQ
jgi:hypothetical protein